MQTPRSGRSAGARRHRRGALFDRRDYPGLEATLEEMARLTHEYLSEPEVREAAAEATRGVSNMRNAQAIAEAVHEWVRSNVKYTRDPVGIELLQSPDVLVRKIRELEGSGRKPMADCDGMAVLAAALLGNVGVEPGFRAIAQVEAGQYDHVYVIYEDGGRWNALDPTIERRPGTDPYDPRSTKEIKLKTMDDLADARRPVRTPATARGFQNQAGTPGITRQGSGQGFDWQSFLSRLIGTVPDTVRAFRGQPPQRQFPVRRQPRGRPTLPRRQAGFSTSDLLFWGSVLAGGGLTIYLISHD